MSQRIVATSRILLLLLAVGAVVAAYVIAAPHDRGATDGAYACPMHPQAVGTGPGTCPICGMPLVAVGAEGPTEETGDRVVPTAGEITVAQRRLFDDAIQGPAWIDAEGHVAALLYNEDVAVLAQDERASFVTATTRPGAISVVRRGMVPPSPWDSSLSRVSFRAVGAAGAPAPGTVGHVVFSSRAREALVVPAAAILKGTEGTFVLAAISDSPAFAKRPVVVGKVVRGFAVIASGLSDQERVVVRDAFFLDAEQRLHSTAD